MVSVTLILRSGGRGPDWKPKEKDWPEGPGLAGCWGGDREWVQGCLHSWESPERLLAKHTSSPVLTPGPELRMEGMCPEMALPTRSSRAQGRWLSWGALHHSCQCLQPTSGSLSLGGGGGGMSLSSTISFPVEPKKEGVGAGRAGAQGGCPKPQPQRNSLGWSGSLFILSPGSWAR